jgi:nucleotide-binding universal stress UspA family protein
VEEVRRGELLVVGPGEVVPVDGVAAAPVVLDESALTGESRPVEREAGSPIRSGGVNAGPPFELRAVTSAEESSLDVRLQHSLRHDPEVGVLLDRAAVAEHDFQVLVLHLLAPGEDQFQLARSEQVVERMVAGLRRCGVRAHGRVRAAVDGPADEIGRTALAYGADLIVMGSRRLPALTALLLGKVSNGRPPVHRPLGTS